MQVKRIKTKLSLIPTLWSSKIELQVLSYVFVSASRIFHPWTYSPFCVCFPPRVLDCLSAIHPWVSDYHWLAVVRLRFRVEPSHRSGFPSAASQNPSCSKHRSFPWIWAVPRCLLVFPGDILTVSFCFLSSIEFIVQFGPIVYWFFSQGTSQLCVLGFTAPSDSGLVVFTLGIQQRYLRPQSNGWFS